MRRSSGSPKKNTCVASERKPAGCGNDEDRAPAGSHEWQVLRDQRFCLLDRHVLQHVRRQQGVEVVRLREA